MEMAYYPGCSLQQSSGLYDVQSRMVFSELGAPLREIEDWNCCGATSAGKVNDFLSVAMAARNIGIAEAAGYEEMVIPCSACYSRTMVAKQRMADNPGMAAEINADLAAPVRGTLKVRSVLEGLLALVAAGNFKERVKNRLGGLQPVCYYGCMLTRFPFDVPVPDDVENPQGMEKVLEALGVRAVDWNYKTYCCGASAAVNDPGTAMNLMGRIMTDAVARGANCFVVTCPMCQMNLDAHQETFCAKAGIEERLPVYFLTELVGVGLGLSPGELQVDRHFVDGTALLKELEHDE